MARKPTVPTVGRGVESVTRKVISALEKAVEELFHDRLSEAGGLRRQDLLGAVGSLQRHDTKQAYHANLTALQQLVRAKFEGDSRRIRTYSDLLMLIAITEFLSRDFGGLPSDRARSLYADEIQRVVTTLSASREYVFDDDVYRKDLCCFTGRMAFCGIYVVDLYAGWPRRYLVRPRLVDAPANLLFILKAGGFSRFAQLHLHSPAVEHFSKAARDHSFMLLSEYLRSQPDILGVMGSAWYYDPCISEVSPRLAYLRETPQNNGARVVCIGRSDSAEASALSKSATRRALHRNGKYAPMEFAMLWPRKSFLAWAMQGNAAS